MLRMVCRVCVPALLGLLAATPASALGIATITDVINGGYRQPPGDEERRAVTSDELVSDEALRTDRDSRIAVKFVDGSELNVEAQSEVILSDYLFDPQTAAASGTINLNKGLFHFNSNNVPENGLKLQTPVATIGIRGTEFLVHVDQDDATVIDILDGTVEVTPLAGGKAITCGGGQSILVETARSDAKCGDLGAFSTAAAPVTQQATDHDGDGQERGKRDRPEPSKPSGEKPNDGGGDPDPGNGGGGGGGGGNPGGSSKGSRSGHSDGTNPGNGHTKETPNGNNGKHGSNNGGTENPGGSK